MFALAQPALAASFKEDFYRVVSAEQAARRQPAVECDQHECRRWWWRDTGNLSLLAVEHVKNSDAHKRLALCWRRAGTEDEMNCVSDAGQRFAVPDADAKKWRSAYIRVNHAASGDNVADLALSCAPPPVGKGKDASGCGAQPSLPKTTPTPSAADRP